MQRVRILSNGLGTCKEWWLVSLVAGDEEGSEAPEPLKVGPTVFVEFGGQVIQVGETIFDDPESLRIKPLGAVEKYTTQPLITVSNVISGPS